MTRLTERETEEIRRAKRAVESEAQQQESRTRFADSAPTPEPTQDPALQALMARHGRLAEIYRGILYKIMLPALRKLRVRRAVQELQGFSDHLLWDLGIDRSQIELVAKELVDRTAPAPRPESRLFAGLRRRRLQRRTIRELSRLDDRQLDDIGLSRDEIFEAAERESLRVALPTPSSLHAMRHGNLSRRAANEMVRLDPAIFADLGDRKLATG